MIVSLTRKVNIYKLTRAWSRHTGMASFSVVTLKEAKMMPRYYNQMNSDILVLMAVTGDQEAREERLIREIMATDNIE